MILQLLYFIKKKFYSFIKKVFLGTKNRVLSRDPNNVWLRSKPKPRMCVRRGVEIIPPFQRVESTTFVNVDEVQKCFISHVINFKLFINM